jgi:hypothetical protein
MRFFLIKQANSTIKTGISHGPAQASITPRLLLMTRIYASTTLLCGLCGWLPGILLHFLVLLIVLSAVITFSHFVLPACDFAWTVPLIPHKSVSRDMHPKFPET